MSDWKTDLAKAVAREDKAREETERLQMHRQEKLNSDLSEAREALEQRALPGIRQFAIEMENLNRRVVVDEDWASRSGPSIEITVFGRDGVPILETTLIAEVTDKGIRLYWKIKGAGRARQTGHADVPGGLLRLNPAGIAKQLAAQYRSASQ